MFWNFRRAPDCCCWLAAGFQVWSTWKSKLSSCGVGVGGALGVSHLCTPSVIGSGLCELMLDPTIHGVRQIEGLLLCCHFTKEYHGDTERQGDLQINRDVRVVLPLPASNVVTLTLLSAARIAALLLTSVRAGSLEKNVGMRCESAARGCRPSIFKSAP